MYVCGNLVCMSVQKHTMYMNTYLAVSTVLSLTLPRSLSILTIGGLAGVEGIRSSPVTGAAPPWETGTWTPHYHIWSLSE